MCVYVCSLSTLVCQRVSIATNVCADDCAGGIMSSSEWRQMQLFRHTPAGSRDRQPWLSAVSTYNTYLSAAGGELSERLTKSTMSAGRGEWVWGSIGSLCCVMRLCQEAKDQDWEEEGRKWMWRRTVMETEEVENKIQGAADRVKGGWLTKTCQ